MVSDDPLSIVSSGLSVCSFILDYPPIDFDAIFLKS